MSRHETIDGVPNFTDIDAFLADGPEAAVALCVPPSVRTAMALKALARRARRAAREAAGGDARRGRGDGRGGARGGRVLFATWHSRFAPCGGAGQGLARRADGALGAAIVWKEDVRRWHPGQAWIWQPAGFGVFDPGINALSILTEILPGGVRGATTATLTFPENRDTPIAATLAMTGAAGFPVAVELDWRQEGPQSWDITVETDGGRLELQARRGADAGRRRASVRAGPDREYPEHLPPLRRAARARARATSTRARSGSAPTPS